MIEQLKELYKNKINSLISEDNIIEIKLKEKNKMKK